MAGKYHVVHSGQDPKKVHCPDKVRTYGISTCMGIGIINHRTGDGYLAHYWCFSTEQELLVDRAIVEATYIGDLEVALAGNIPLDRESVELLGDDYDKSLEQYRAHGRWALEMLRSKGITRIQNHLENDPIEGSYEMTVDTEKRRIDVEMEQNIL